MSNFPHVSSNIFQILLQGFESMFSQLSKVLVALFLHITPRFAVPLSDFYPYGVSEGDTALPANDDGSSGVISISILFPYFDRNHDSLYVSKYALFII